MTSTPRWFTDHGPGHSDWYVERFRTLAAEGADLAGEARLVDAIAAPRSRVLDAGCGPGRIGAALHDRGHAVVGVDVDPALIAAAEQDHRGPRWVCADLTTFDLSDEEPFDAAVSGGNVMPYLAPGTGAQALGRIAAHVRSDAPVVVGFGAGRGYDVSDFDDDARSAGLVVEQRFATWDLRPWTDDASFSVTILRKP